MLRIATWFAVAVLAVSKVAWADDPPDDQGDHKPEPAADKDHDGKPDEPAAADKDHDGKPDAPAAGAADDTKDSDGDGVPDAKEDSDGDGIPDSKEDADGDGIPDVAEKAGDADGDGVPDSAEGTPGDIDGDGTPDAQEEFDPDDPPTDPFDADGDGQVEPDEIADRKEFLAEFADIPDQVDEAALDARPEDTELAPSLTVEKFRKLVAIAKKVVLGKMAKKIALKADKRMAKFSWMVFGLSLAGLLLLAMPLALKKKYPGQGKVLLKYSALAAATFFVTVNLFGAVLFGMRSAQGALSNYTNPSIAVARGTFDTLDKNAEFYVATGKELFGPTLEQMNKHPEEQPAVLLLENGVRIVQDAMVFMKVKKLLKSVDFLFGVLPIVLTLVTLILFILAIKPTLTQIVKLPAMAASGQSGVGGEVVKNSLRRVKGEMLATLCTIGVLTVLTLISAVILGQVVMPALEALLLYFSEAVNYLQFVEGASSGLVFVALFGVIFFLALNLAALILSMSFFLGKSQKIFQARFNEGTPIATHRRFWKWGIPSVLLVQVFPWLFVFVAQAILMKINHGILDGVLDAEAISWKKLMLMGPLFLVGAFLVLFWAVRGVKAIKFLATYKVKPKAPRAADSSIGHAPVER